MTVLIAASINLFGQTDSARDVTLTYHSADNSAVDNSGKNIDTWGKEFGIKHYLVFEMKFE